MSVISAESLSKTFITRISSGKGVSKLKSFFAPTYRKVDAVKGISFSVDEGEVVAFLGPNGAGKSTTIKMLTGILKPTSGSSKVLGFDPSRQRTKLSFHIGSVFGQKSQLWFHLPPSDSFTLLAAIYEIDKKVFARRMAELVERFGIHDLMDVPVRKLSLGQRIRCEIAASLLHSPKILFLDEPTIGLDVVVKREIRALLSELNKNDKVTVFLTSHDIGDIEKICKRAIIIHHGTIVVDENMKELKHKALAKKIIGVKYSGPTSIDIPGISPVKRTPDAVRFEIDTRSTDLSALVKRLVDSGEVEDITIEDEPLENLIAEVFESENEEEAHAAAGKKNS